MTVVANHALLALLNGVDNVRKATQLAGAASRHTGGPPRGRRLGGAG